jgi:glycogen(starch) synthase
MISVVINTLGRPLELEKALVALSKQTFEDFEVVVVFGPNDEISQEIVNKFFPTAKQSSVDVENLSISRNEGIRNSAGEWVAFLDDDGIPEADYLEELHKFAEAKDLDIVSGPLVDRTGLEYQSLSVTSNIHGESYVFKSSKHELPFLTEINALWKNYPSVIGANFMIRRRTLELIGGYDEVFEYFLDETDLCIRAVKMGAKIGYASHGVVHHKWRAGVVRGENRVVSNYWPILKNFAYFNLKHASPHFTEIYLKKKYQEFAAKCEKDLIWAVSNKLLTPDHLEKFKIHDENAWSYATDQHSTQVTLKSSVNLQKQTEFLKFSSRATESIVITCKGAGPGSNSGIGNLIRRQILGLAKEEISIKVIYLDQDVFDSSGEAITYNEGIWWINAAAIPTSFQYDHESQLSEFNIEHHGSLSHVGDFASRVQVWISWLKEHTSISGIFTQSWDAEAYFLAKKGIPYAVFSYTPARVAQELCLDQDLKETLGQLWESEKKVLESAQLVIFDSFFLKQDLSDLKILNSEVCYPGVTKNELKPPHDSEDFFLYIGSADPRKGLNWLIKTWKLSLEVGREFKLVIVGLTQEELRNFLLKENIYVEKIPVCLGRISDEELAHLYSSCLAVIIPSKYESFGLPTIEGMSYGKPFVGASNSALLEIASSTSAGILVQTDNTELLLDVLTQTPHEHFRKIGNKGLVACSELFSQETSTRELSQIINRYMESLKQSN